MLFDATNEALNYIRPLGVFGMPMIWQFKPIPNFRKKSSKEIQ